MQAKTTHLQQLADRDSDQVAIRAELCGAHGPLERHVVQQHAAAAVHDQRAAVLVD